MILGFNYLGPEWCVNSVGHGIRVDLHSALTRSHSPHESSAFIRFEEVDKTNSGFLMQDVPSPRTFVVPFALLSRRADICYTDQRFVIQRSSWQSELLACTVDWLIPLQQIDCIGG